ncbi:MAG: 2-C-methyl-D-erythritol 4-phosphate cytidylyltransferase [Thermoguttaceae bacterium]|nr:2-C-methyl-D-erythritol 4-phosphate cytidylyltransferase [Thermoguttaceae bacterium]MDW8079081.1 2-C-methyl-D-erythritol 4-phosphate cytidylyltransferase [Thermoguttaceae bacterium]
MKTLAVILPAAGKSTRFGDRSVKKQFALLDGRPVWVHSAERFVGREDVRQIVLVVAPEDEEYFREKFGSTAALLGVEVVVGGAERCHSVEQALKKIRRDVDLVCIHDAARPCLASTWIDKVIEVAGEKGAAILAVPVTQTIKRVSSDGKIETTVPRTGLWEAQTPQVFRLDWILDAYARRGNFIPTDDAQVLEQAGYPVYVVPGSPLNIKIATRDDLRLAEQILPLLRRPVTGPGHPFAEDQFWR